MKKHTVIISVLLLALLLLCACGAKQEPVETPVPAATEAPAVSTPEPTPEPTPAPTPPLSVDSNGNFEVYGQTFNINDTEVNLSHIEIDDNGAAIASMLPFMKNCTLLDLDSCGRGEEFDAAAGKIREDNPNVKVVWRIWFGENYCYSVRTDVERILASQAAGSISVENGMNSLKYCTEVKYLDIGHNSDVTNIDFTAYMPRLEVAILAMSQWTDCSPLANCPNLWYLEMQTTGCNDLSPLAGLKKLTNLNICYDTAIWDISPLYGLPLERLWIGKLVPVSEKQLNEFKALHPDCKINTTTIDPTAEEWRYIFNTETLQNECDPAYERIREIFEYSNPRSQVFTYNDPLY